MFPIRGSLAEGEERKMSKGTSTRTAIAANQSEECLFVVRPDVSCPASGGHHPDDYRKELFLGAYVELRIDPLQVASDRKNGIA